MKPSFGGPGGFLKNLSGIICLVSSLEEKSLCVSNHLIEKGLMKINRARERFDLSLRFLPYLVLFNYEVYMRWMRELSVSAESWETADSIFGPYFLNFADFKKYFARYEEEKKCLNLEQCKIFKVNLLDPTQNQF